MKTVKIGMVQSLVVFDAAKENLARSAEGVRLAASKGAQICVLPECGDLGWPNRYPGTSAAIFRLWREKPACGSPPV